MNPLGLIPLAIAAIGGSYGILVLRGWHRRDNLMFGLIAVTDALITAWRGVNVLTGGSLVARGVITPCMYGTIVLALLTPEFIVAFPRRRPMSWRWRALLLAWGVAGAILSWNAREPGNFVDRGELLAELVFYIPATLLVFGLGLRTYLRTPERDAGTVTWIVGPMIGHFEALAWFESTFAAGVSFAVIGGMMLRSELFSIRSSSVEVLTYAAFGVLIMLGGGGAVMAALSYVPPGRLQEVALYGSTLVPLGLAAIGHAMYPRVERRVLAGLDERRARRLGIQGDPLPADAAAAIAEACHRVAAIGEGTTVRWVPNDELPPDVAAQLTIGDPLRKGEIAGLPACFVIPALGAERMLVGAFYLDDGLIDRETYV
ncbi:MAG: hypothetical protein JF590_07900, partial [Gemmatimonadetes bacterium]|nr:hypothetical protein [Gemmatimonadota bacterium]